MHLSDSQDDDERVQIVYEEEPRTVTPPVAATAAPSRRQTLQAQLQQQQRGHQGHADQAAQQWTQQEELLRHASPPLDADAGTGRAASPPKRHSAQIESQLWADASQLQPVTPPPTAAESKAPLSLADLKAEMLVGSAAQRGPQRTPRGRQPHAVQSVRRRASFASPPPRSSGRQRQRQQPPGSAISGLRNTSQADGGTPGPVMSMGAALSLLRSQATSEQRSPPAAQDVDEGQMVENISSGEEQDMAAPAARTPAQARQPRPAPAEPMHEDQEPQPNAAQPLQKSWEEQAAARLAGPWPPQQPPPPPPQQQQQQQHVSPSRGPATTPGGGMSAQAFIAALAPATTPRASRRGQAASQSLSARLQHALQSKAQVQGAAQQRAGLSLSITARRMEGHLIMARVDCMGGFSASSMPPVYAVFAARSRVELDVGCKVIAQPPLHIVVLPSGDQVVLCPDVVQG